MNKNQKYIRSLAEYKEIYAMYILLRETAHAINTCRGSELRQLGVTQEQVGALICIHNLGKDATASTVSRYLLREANTLTANLKRMEKKGFIKRTVDLKEKNIVRLYLTTKGYEVCNRAMDIKVLNKIYGVLSDRKRQLLNSILRTLLNQTIENSKFDDKYFDFILDNREIFDEKNYGKTSGY